MQGTLDRITRRYRSLITRGKVISAALNPNRPLLQLSGLAGEIKAKIELFMPMGMSCFPSGNEELILMSIAGSPHHMVAMFADNPALRISDLQKGEFGFRDTNGQQIVFRSDHLEVTTPLKVVMNVTGTLTANVTGDANITSSGTATLQGKTVNVTGDTVNLGGSGGQPVARLGDKVSGGYVIIGGSTTVNAT